MAKGFTTVKLWGRPVVWRHAKDWSYFPGTSSELPHAHTHSHILYVCVYMNIYIYITICVCAIVCVAIGCILLHIYSQRERERDLYSKCSSVRTDPTFGRSMWNCSGACFKHLHNLKDAPPSLQGNDARAPCMFLLQL